MVRSALMAPHSSFTMHSFARPPREGWPLCQDLDVGVMQPGEKCWSSCDKSAWDCKNRVLFTTDENKDKVEMLRHPVCRSHFECVGDRWRVICEAHIRGQEREPPKPISGPAQSCIGGEWLHGDLLLRNYRHRHRRDSTRARSELGGFL
mmetsp:Transcript_25602/g.59625  ORF Transcript_25602/g.59625 Transcript_25602/m.59625 type:complete len:149 (+) Transcript_25602:79-525(+)